MNCLSRTFTFSVCLLVIVCGSLFGQNCPTADLSGDCAVGWNDLVIFGGQWLDNPGGSANLDGVAGVEGGDFAVLASEWGLQGVSEMTLVINEFMADNTDFVLDNAGEDDDWIEIFNYGSRSINIGGMYISDDLTDLDPWQIPVTASDETTIPAGGYLLIWADNDSWQGALHTEFALSAGGGEDIVLYDSDRNVIDSIAGFGSFGENNSYGRLPDAGTQWSTFVHDTESPPTPGHSNGGRSADKEILITEIMYHPYNSSHPLSEDIGEEYIELYNRGFGAVNLLGWQFTDGVAFTFGDVSIDPGEYLVVAGDIATFNAKYPGVTNVTGGWQGRLSNSGEGVELANADNQVIDRITYADEGGWAVRYLGPVDDGHRGWLWADDHDGDGKSLELISMAVSNEYGQNWGASVFDGGTPGAENTATGYEPDSVALVTTGAIWRYLDNGSNQQTAWKEVIFDDSLWKTGASQLGYGGNGEVTTVEYGPDANNKYITTYFRHSFNVADASEYASLTLKLRRDDGAIVYLNGVELPRSNMPSGTVDYTTLATGNIAGSAENVYHEYPVNISLLVTENNVIAVEVHQDAVTSSDLSFDLILEAVIKPPEGPAVVDIAPIISDAEHMPMIPNSDEEVTVTAEVIDEDIASVVVNVLYRADGAASFSSTAMLDDGLNGDDVVGDGLYHGTIPAMPDGAVVEFYISATDAASNSRTQPAVCYVDGTAVQACNMLYQVDDSYDRDAKWQEGVQPIYRIIMIETERAELDSIGAGNGEDSDAQMNATFISVDGVDTKVRYNIGVRNRGHGTRASRPNNYRVNFNSDRSWKDQSAINLNTQYSWLQLAGSAIFQRSNLPIGNATAVGVRVNGIDFARTDGRQYGSYVHVEVINSEFADNHFPDNGAGNIYKCMRVGSQADLRYEGANPDPYRVHYFKRTNESQDDWSDLIDLTYALSSNTADDIYIEEVNRVLNIDIFLRAIALNVMLDNSETTLSNGNGDDYYLYRGDTDRRFMMIQHDLDSIIGQGQTIGSTTGSIFPFMSIGALNRLVSHPEIAPRYYGQLKDLIETTLSAEQIGPFLDNVLGDFVPAAMINSMKSWVATRNDYVLSQIPSELTIEPSLFEIGDYYQTAGSEVALSGNADAVNTKSVTANGLAANWSAIDGEWSIGEGSSGTNEEIIVRRNSIWRYLDDGSNQGTAWYGTGFVDDAWSSGTAQLGYGGNGEVTTVGFGGDSSNKYITTYFRHSFNVDDASRYTGLRLRVLRDDGAVVYINGVEITPRSNMPSGTISYTTFASSVTGGTDETTFYEYTVDSGLLNNGINVLAAEVHQVNVTSSDISFNLELSGQLEETPVSNGVPINPGITRITVQTFDGPGGTGNELDREYIDIWQNDSTPTILSGTLTEDMTLDIASGPYYVTADLTIPAGITLEIEGGCTLLFATGAGITVNGRLVAEGTEFNHIRMVPDPASGTQWDGLRFSNTLADNRLVYVDMEYGDAQGDSIIGTSSRILINYMTFASTNNSTPFMELTRPSAVIRNTVFPSITSSEPLHGSSLSGSEYLIFDGCTFGSTTGYNDIVDFTGGQRPGPILQFYNCTFLGGGDDGPDLDNTDCHIEGCYFTNFHQAAGSSSPSYAVATGDGSEVCIVRNVFIDNDHCVLHKEDVYTWIQNNVFLDATIAAISFGEPFRNPPRTPGRGTYMDSNIFRNNAAMFEHLFDNPVDYGPTGSVGAYRSILPAQWHYMGTDNLDVDPMFVNPNSDVTLQAGSPAIGAGANGLDMGYLVAAGASVSGEPVGVTSSTAATLQVAGPGITHYKYRLVDNDAEGAWSAEVALPINALDFPADPDNVFGTIELIGLQDGHTYRVDVLGKNSAGLWQGTEFGLNTGFVVPGNPEGNSTQSWTVDLAASGALLSKSLPESNMGDLMDVYNNGFVAPQVLTTSLTLVDGTLTSDTVWTVDESPYQVSAELIVPVGVTLTIMPGTTVFFDSGTQMTVRGTLRAEGAEYDLIYFTVTPGGGSTWDGIQLVDTSQDNLISYAMVNRAVTSSGSIGLANSNAVIEHVAWGGSRRRLIHASYSSLIVRNCVFPDRFGPGEYPNDGGGGDDNVVEDINATGIMSGGHFIIENNIFGTNKGHNDVIDFSGPTLPGPILEVRNNIFMGGGDEMLDLGGDAYIDGNIFMHVRKDMYNTGSGESNVISTGDDNVEGVLMITRNVFYDIDHVINLKKDTYMFFENNTVVGIPDDQGAIRFSVINFLIPGRDPEGKGAYLDGNIFRDIPQRIFDRVDEGFGGEPVVTDLEMHNCLVPLERAGDAVGLRAGTIMDLGSGNFVGDPLFVDSTSDWHLKASSPAVGAGGNGADLGAMIPAGASISGEPRATTFRTEAVLTVGGAGISDYKYRVNSGSWSSEYQVDTAITLSGLIDAESYTVAVIGRNFVGVWQEESNPTASKTWTVDTAFSQLVISEVLANNVSTLDYQGTASDLIELYYDGPVALDMSGMSISDDPDNPGKFVFAAGTSINPGEHLVLYADQSIATTDIHLGFGMDDEGEGVYLYDSAGTLIDSVIFGLQLADLSIGRVDGGQWTLTVPSIGAANIAQPLGDRATLKINEWFANGDVLVSDDFIELYNRSPYPVDLSGLYLTDDPVMEAEKHLIGPLSFIAREGYAVYVADRSDSPGHLNFRLSSDGEMIGLFEYGAQEIDCVLYGPQATDISQGRTPDGAAEYSFFTIPTPGVMNPYVPTGGTIETNLMGIHHVWSYNQSNTNLLTAWRGISYDDSAWPTGAALLYVEGSSLPATKNTPLTLGASTYYFRSTFDVPSEVNLSDIKELNFSTVIDDAAVIFINGQEAFRVGFNANTTVTHTTMADRTVTNASYEYFTIPPTGLVAGENVIAVEVHQASSNSSDIVFGLAIDAAVDVLPEEDPLADAKLLLDNLRITEIMYNPVGGRDLEFMELINTGTEDLNLAGVRIDGGIGFAFGDTILSSGEYVVVVNDLLAFRSRYTETINIAGEYTGNLSNAGEDIVLMLPWPLEVGILRFEYDDLWYPETDGDGYSLVIVDPYAAIGMWDDSGGWRQGTVIDGTPGASDL